MEGFGSVSSSEGKRFLQNLGKKLLSGSNLGQRWSLKEGTQDNELLDEMGVSLLEKPSKSNDLLDNLNEDIENHSPNTKPNLKRTHSKANLSLPDLAATPLQEIDTVSAKKMPFGLSPSSSHRNIIKSSPNVQTKKSIDRRKSVGESNSSQKFNKTENNDYDSDLKSNDCDNEKSSNSDLIHVSPLTTCVPHPPFHKQPKTLPRHTTFDDETTVDEEHDFDVTQNIVTEDSSEYCEGNVCPSNEILDVKKSIIKNSGSIQSSAKSPDCPTIEEHENEECINEEKECFAVDNLSFCDSCDKKIEHFEDCSSVMFNDNEGAFSNLYDELVVSIFKWLPKKMLVRCMLVCKRWHRLSLDSRLWARVCLGGKTLDSGVLPNLMDRHPLVLRLANSQLLSPAVPDSSSSIKWRVQYLDLSAATVSPQCLGEILNRCPALLRLSLEGLAMCESSSAALGKLVNLKVLNLALATNLGEVAAKAIALIPRMEALNLAWTRLDDNATKILCEGLPSSMQRLNLSGFQKTLTEKLIKTVVERCPDLVELDISDCIMTGDNLIPILFNLKSLEHLAISRCNRLKRNDFGLLQEFPRLQWIDVFGLVSPLTPITLAALTKLLPKIKFNQFVHSAIARPTVGIRRTSIWGLRTID